MKIHFSIKYKVAIPFIILAIFNIILFSSMILENQMGLLAEINEYNSSKFIDSVEKSIKGMASDFQINKIKNEKENEKVISKIENTILSLIKIEESEYIIFIQDGTAIKKSSRNIELPSTYVYDSMRAQKNKNFNDKDYFVDNDGRSINFYMNLYNYQSQNYLLFIKHDLKEMNESIGYLYGLITIVVAAILLSHMLFAFIIYRTVLKPIKKLDESSKEINTGNLDKRVKIKSNDEIGSLGNTFNIMAQSIQNKPPSFMVNNSTSETVTVDIFNKQKSIFTEREERIGGDLCYSNDIQLNEKQYTLFFNADVMLNVINGHGSPNVMASIFITIVEKTSNGGNKNQLFPESWLRNLYHELQKDFMTNEEKISVSFVLGLVDNDNGVVYFCNSRHTGTVLYSEGNSSFIVDEQINRRSVDEIANGHISIHTLQLKRGDSLIISPEIMNKEISMDKEEVPFLKIVEESKGDLQSIYDLISAKSEITDDFSMIRIKFDEIFFNYDEQHLKNVFEDVMEFIENDKHDEVMKILTLRYEQKKNIPILKKIIDIYLSEKDFENALIYLEKYMIVNPGDTNYLFFTSYCKLKTEDMDGALQLAERILVREPLNRKYLKFYIKLCYVNGDLAAVKHYAKLLLELEPGNSYARKVIDIEEQPERLRSLDVSHA